MLTPNSISCSWRSHVALALLTGICTTICARVTIAADIWIVTDHHHPVQAPPPGACITELDAARSIEAIFAQRLPSHPDQAAAVATQRLDALTPELTRTLAAAYQGIVDAWSMGITKIPAVIVDRRYIVYGERDVRRAVREIERYRSAQR